MRKQETAIATAAREVQAIDAQLNAQTGELDSLDQRREALAGKLRKQREALAVLLRSAYALGRSEELKLLLQQDDVGSIARVLAYHRYFQRARVDRIDGLMTDLGQLAEVQEQIEAKRLELTATRKQRELDVTTLQTQRDERALLLDQLDGQMKDQQARLAVMAKDEKGLLEPAWASADARRRPHPDRFRRPG